MDSKTRKLLITQSVKRTTSLSSECGTSDLDVKSPLSLSGSSRIVSSLRVTDLPHSSPFLFKMVAYRPPLLAVSEYLVLLFCCAARDI